MFVVAALRRPKPRIASPAWHFVVGLILQLMALPVGAQQFLVATQGQAIVKVPDWKRLSEDGTFVLHLETIPAGTNAALGTTNEIRFGDVFTSVLPDEWTFGGGPDGPILPIPSVFERVVLPGGIIATQMICNPSYSGGIADPTNLASFQPPDPLPGLTATSRTRAATSIQQAGLACILNNASSFTSQEFLDQLGVSAQVKQWYAQGYRADLQGLTRSNRVLVRFDEAVSPDFLAVFDTSNLLLVRYRTGADYFDWATSEPLSPGFDCGVLLGDYAGLVAGWLIGCTNFLPYRTANANLLALNNGLSTWVAYMHDGNPDVYKYASYVIRQVGARPCGTITNNVVWTNYANQVFTNYGGFPDCFKGNNIRNVMMYDETNTTHGTYPFGALVGLQPPTGSNYDGPISWDLAGIYFGAIFYDISQEVGLGDAKANLLIWKTFSIIDVCDTFPMRNFATYVLAAANLLWPDAAHPGQSIYDTQLKDVLRSRGIAIGAESDFRQNLPAPIGPVRKASANQFGSSIPESHPTTGSYGFFNYFENSYTQPGTATNDYVVYQFYKHSKYGPCDKLIVTDGTFTDLGSTNFSYDANGSYYHELQDRELGNLLLMVPGATIDFVRLRQRCFNEHDGFYPEDVRPFGFRVIQAVTNGFVWKTTRLYSSSSNIMYQFEIVDPSQTTLGPATYSWTFTDPTGNSNQLSGATAYASVAKEQPLQITVSRVRGGQTNTITMSEPSNGLDKNDRPHWLVGIKTPQNALNAADAPHYFNIEPSPLFTSYVRAGDGSFTLNFSGITNATYSLWASTNLTTWQPLGSATQLTPGAYQFEDATGTNLQQRFYQVRKP